MQHASRARSFDHGWLVIAAAVILLSGCSDGRVIQNYQLSGTISGLIGNGLVLSVNGASVAVPSGTSSVQFSSELRSGAAYTVTVATQPDSQICSVAGGSGTVSFANVSNVVVTCSAQGFTLGGTISGLNVSGLQLANGADTLQVATGATTFAMPAKVAVSSSYQLTVSNQPPGAVCAVNNGAGTMPAHALRDIAITCSDGSFTVSGSITGLGANSGLVLTNGSDSLHVDPSAGHFSMVTRVHAGDAYSVQVLVSPPGLTCSTENGAGTIGATAVTDIVVTCSNAAYAVRGTVTNLNAAGLKLANGSDTLDVGQGASNFLMPKLVAHTGSYNITVAQNPTHETCTVANGSAVMGTADVTDVAVTCSTVAVTIQGTVSGLGANSGLVLLDNNGDATSVSANATSFSMHTPVAYGSSYNLTVGSQPYGIGVACTVSGGSGTAADSMTAITVDCAAVSAVTQNEILGYFSYPVDVVLDANRNLIVADANDAQARSFPFNNGSYGTRPALLPGDLLEPQSLTLDSHGNLFIADSLHQRVLRVDYTNGSYGTTATTVASGFQIATGVAVDSTGNVFVSDPYAHTVSEVLYNNGSYGSPATVGSGFNEPTGLALDSAGNLFVADNNSSSILEIVNNNGSYAAAAVPVGSGLNVPTDVTFDAQGNLLVADTHNNDIKEFLESGGNFGSTGISLGSTWHNSQGIAVDSVGNLFVADSVSNVVKELAFTNGNFAAAPITVGPGYTRPVGAALDAHGNLFIADSGNGMVAEIPYNNGNYGGTPAALSSGLSFQNNSVALDSSGNLFVIDSSSQTLLEFTYNNGTYSTTPVTLASGFTGVAGLAVDAVGNVFVADGLAGTIQEYLYANGSYSPSATQVAAGLQDVSSIAVDSRGNVFAVVGMFFNVELDVIACTNGTYSNTPTTLTNAFFQINGVVVDKSDNVFFGDAGHGTVQEFVLTNGSYGASPVTVSTGYQNLEYLAIDSHGRVYAGDIADLKMLTP